MENQDVNPFDSEPDFEEPDFDEEPPFSAPAPAPAQNPAALAGRLGWTLEPATEAEALKIGAALGLRADDVMWPLILLQLRTVSTFSAVPAEVQKVIDQTAEAAEITTKMAAAEAASTSAKNAKKEIFKALVDGQNKSLKPFFAAAAGAGCACFFLGGFLGFWLGNIASMQHNWTLEIAKIIGIGV